MAKSGPATQPKRPRRKYRRRPSRLLEEYKKRSNKVSWLETHLWHAKRSGFNIIIVFFSSRRFQLFLPCRFHMTIKWGYRLPERSCARSHRFCYRSVAEHCLLMVLILNFDDHTCFNYFIFLRTYHTYVVLKFKVPRMRSFMVLSHSVIPKTAQLLALLPFLKVIVKEE